MKKRTLVYLNNDVLQIVKAGHEKERFSVSHFETVVFEPNTVVNGNVINENPIVDALRDKKHLLRDFTLVIDSSAISAKLMPFPNLSKQQALTLVRSEFVTLDSGIEEYFYDANLHYSPDGNALVGYAVPVEMFESYIDAFQKAGIVLKNVDIALNCFIKTTHKTAQFRGETFILNIVYGGHMCSLIFENGNYIFSTRSRLMNESGSPEYTRELLASLSSLLQFSQSQKSAYKINKSFYIGITDEALDYLLPFADSYEVEILGSKMSENPVEKLILHEYIYPVSGVIREKNDVNLIEQYKNISKKKVSSKSVLTVIFPILLAMLIGGLSGLLYILDDQNDEKIATLRDDIKTLVNQNIESGVYSRANQLDTVRGILNLYEDARVQLADLSRFKSLQFSEFLALSGSKITLTSLSANQSEGTLSLSGLALDETQAASYIERLKDSGLFSDVEYNGYAWTGIDFSFTATCILKAGEQHE